MNRKPHNRKAKSKSNHIINNIKYMCCGANIPSGILVLCRRRNTKNKRVKHKINNNNAYYVCVCMRLCGLNAAPLLQKHIILLHTSKYMKRYKRNGLFEKLPSRVQCIFYASSQPAATPPNHRS